MNVAFAVLIGGLLTLPLPDGVNRAGGAAVCAFVLIVGLAALRAPWDDWPRSSTLWIIGADVIAVTIGGFVAFEAVAYSFAVFPPLVYMWIGISQPRGTSLRLTPFITASLVSVYLHATNDWGASLRNAAVVIAAGLVIGELLAWISAILVEVEERDALHIAKQRALLEAATALAYQPEYETASYLVARTVGELIESDTAAVLITDDTGLTLVASWPDPAEPVHLPGQRVERIVSRAMLGEAVLLPALPDCPISQLLGARTIYALPIRGEDHTLGVAVAGFDSDAPPITQFLEELVGTYARQAGLAFERVWATQDLLDDTLRDELTGVGNRRHIAALLAHIQPGDAIAMLDLDHFKSVNDQLGHATGDEVLRRLGAFLREQLRDSDSVARYGGEEFLLVLRKAGEAGADKVERLMERWRASAPLATFSAGIAIHALEQTPGRTLELADQALYRAKRLGRDRVALAASAHSHVEESVPSSWS